MGILNANKEVSKKTISCGEKFQIKLSLSGAPSIQRKPLDIVLVLDRSGSMTGMPLTNLKKGVCEFLDLLDVESDGIKNGIIGGGSKVSIVSFASSATIDVPLSASVSDLKGAINTLSAGGTTNHKEAFLKGISAFSASSTNDKVLIIFTDGKASATSEGIVEAERAKGQGITIYSLGYGTDGTLSTDILYKWASSPSSAYTLISPEVNDIEALFTGLLTNISQEAAKNISISDTVSDCFSVVSFDEASKGQGTVLNNKSVKWTVPVLGETGQEGAYCIFTVQHTGNCNGKILVNKDIDYFDATGNTVNFPKPTIEVLCDTPTIIEDCPVSNDIVMDGCLDSAEYVADDLTLNSLGRILQLSVTLKNVCPNKRVALAVLVYEVNARGEEQACGMKTLLIPAQTGSACKDIVVRCIKFVIPEELDTIGNRKSLCNSRHFKAKFIANYVDSDYFCCETP